MESLPCFGTATSILSKIHFQQAVAPNGRFGKVAQSYSVLGTFHLRPGSNFKMIQRLPLLASAKQLLAASAVIAAMAEPAVIAIAHSTPVRAQQPASKFEVTSVKPNKSGVRRYDISPKGNRFVATNVTLFALVEWAYHIEAFRIVGDPSWMTSDHFDIEAKAEGNASMDQFRWMLQTLLADRFDLKLHRETRELPRYGLVVAKGGPKLKAGKCFGTPSPANPCGGTSGSTRGTLIGRATSMEVLAQALSGILTRDVLDRTRLGGVYDFDLTWTPDELARQGPGDADAPPLDVNGGSIFTALQEQLGLRIESEKGPVEVLVIDGAKKPTEN
jgi:uncharacterized protein (TIGR03435 family)